jgi:7-cyano-7-deazaguanine synthase
MPHSIILLSAGLDSTVNLKCALDAGRVLKALTFDYGQRAAKREIACAAAQCARFGINHEIIRLPWLKAITRTALVADKPLPKPKAALLDNADAAARAAARVWVPNRNGVFLEIAAAFADSLNADQIVPGFNAEEAATFPDNSAEYGRALTKALKFSTRDGVKVKCYTSRKRKTALLRHGMKIGAALDLIWCCYQGGRRMCGQCESCMRFVRAVEETKSGDWFRARHKQLPPQLAARRP